MTPRRYRTTWNCPHCPVNVTVFAHLEHPPTHPCQPRMGHRFALVLVTDEPPEAA